MKVVTLLQVLTVGVIMAASTHAQDTTGYAVTQLSDHIYKLSIDGGGYPVKVIASVGKDGILLVDTGKREHAEKLKQAVQKLGSEIPKIIVNTHAHAEHIGGNAIFGTAPVIVAHEKVRTRMRSGSLIFDEYPDEALPTVLLSDSLSLYFNGEEIKLLAYPGAHDNCDIIVWFTGSKIACVGALCNGTHFPSVDEAWGDVNKYPEVSARALSRLPEDVRIVPGHGIECTMDDFRKFHDMLVKTAEVVRAEAAKGKDAATMKSEDVLKEWASFDGDYTDRNTMIDYLVKGLAPRDTRKPIYELMYYTIKEKGADGAIAAYKDLKANHATEYQLDEVPLLIIPYKLFNGERYADAVKLFEYYLSEYPTGEYAWMGYHNLGRSYMKLGDKERARKNLTKSLELNPDNTRAKEFLEELEG